MTNLREIHCDSINEITSIMDLLVDGRYEGIIFQFTNVSYTEVLDLRYLR